LKDDDGHRDLTSFLHPNPKTLSHKELGQALSGVHLPCPLLSDAFMMHERK